MSSSSYRLRLIVSSFPSARRVWFGRAKALSWRTILLWGVVFSASDTIMRWLVSYASMLSSGESVRIGRKTLSAGYWLGC